MITCTISPPPNVMARLAACPALPRGERLEWAYIKNGAVDRPRRARVKRMRKPATRNQVMLRRLAVLACEGHQWAAAEWRSMARPLRVARERLRAERVRIKFLEGRVSESNTAANLASAALGGARMRIAELEAPRSPSAPMTPARAERIAAIRTGLASSATGKTRQCPGCRTAGVLVELEGSRFAVVWGETLVSVGEYSDVMHQEHRCGAC